MVFALGFMARSMGSEGYGYWVLVLVFQGLLFSLTGLGLSTSLARMSPAAPKKEASGMLGYSLKACLFSLAIWAILILFFQDHIAQLLRLPEIFVVWIGWGLIWVVFQLIESLLDAFFKAREMVLRASLFQVLRTLADVTLIFLVFSLYPIGTQEQIITAIVRYMQALAFVKGALYVLLTRGLDLGGPVRLNVKHDLLRLGLPLVPAALLLTLFYQIDRFVLSRIIDVDLLGVYAFGANIALYLHALGSLAYAMLLPRLSRFYDQGSWGEMRALTAMSQKLFLYLTGSALISLVLIGEEFVQFIAGDEYRQAAPVLVLLGMGVAIDRLFGPYEAVFHLAKRPVFAVYMNFVSCINLGVGVLLGVYLYGGVKGGALGVLFSALLSNLMRFYFARRMFSLGMSAQVIRVAFGLALCVASIMYIVESIPNVLRYCMVICSLLFAAFILIQVLWRGGLQTIEA